MPGRRRRKSLGHVHENREQDLPQVPKNLIFASINKTRTYMLFDTGACVSCMSEKFLHKLGLNIQNDSNTILDTLISADGQTLKVKGQVTATVNLQGLLVSHTFFVIDGLNYWQVRCSISSNTVSRLYAYHCVFT